MIDAGGGGGGGRHSRDLFFLRGRHARQQPLGPDMAGGGSQNECSMASSETECTNNGCTWDEMALWCKDDNARGDYAKDESFDDDGSTGGDYAKDGVFYADANNTQDDFVPGEDEGDDNGQDDYGSGFFSGFNMFWDYDDDLFSFTDDDDYTAYDFDDESNAFFSMSEEAEGARTAALAGLYAKATKVVNENNVCLTEINEMMDEVKVEMAGAGVDEEETFSYFSPEFNGFDPRSDGCIDVECAAQIETCTADLITPLSKYLPFAPLVQSHCKNESANCLASKECAFAMDIKK